MFLFFGEGGTFAAFVSRRFSEKAREMHVFFVIFLTMVTNYRDLEGEYFHKIGEGGGGGGSGDEEREKVPLVLLKWGGGGGRSDRFLDNSDSFDKHISPLIAFSHWMLCFGAIFAIFDFRPCHCLMNVFSHGWLSKVITCNYSHRGEISLSYDIWHLPFIELVYDIIRVE